MKFRTRILLAIIMLSTLSMVSIGAIIYQIIARDMRQTFLERYESLADVTADTLRELDKTTDHLMRNALLAIRGTLNGLPSKPDNNQLRKLRDDLNISSIDYVIPDGSLQG
jgi:hypothetical protein